MFDDRKLTTLQSYQCFEPERHLDFGAETKAAYLDPTGGVWSIPTALAALFDGVRKLDQHGKRLRRINTQIANDIQHKGEFASAMGNKVTVWMKKSAEPGASWDDILQLLKDIYVEYDANGEARAFQDWEQCKDQFYESLSRRDKEKGDKVTQFYRRARVSLNKCDNELADSVKFLATAIQASRDPGLPEAQKREAFSRFVTLHIRALVRSLEHFGEILKGAETALRAFD
ncbi:MAG: hypothetical protein KAH44_25610 [Oricola sp.]|jgi:hypothetical protein|nr:hypothetical protein [Oricola sp.]